MIAEESLKIATSYLDDATENLTFDEFAWAFEESWRGVAHILNALSATPRPSLALGPKGDLPILGTLAELARHVQEPPRSMRIVPRLEALGRTLVGATDLETVVAVNAQRIERLVFDSWELHDDCSKTLGLVDERLGDKLLLANPSPGRVGSQVIHRRTALKLVVAGTLLPAAACRRVEQENRPATAVASSVADPQPTAAKVRSATPLGGMHWQTTDPFLFCAHHFDEYPAGNEKLGPAASLDGRLLGRDFDGKDNWRMYHGLEVPGFPRHPHRGFETVTVVRTGLLDHSDSMGATARYGGGDVQWLTAGGGIQHAEMFPLLSSDSPNPLELFQIWLNLPARDKMVDPYFTMLWSEKIPRVVERDAEGRVVELTLAAGAYKGQSPPPPPPSSWASNAESDLAIWSIRMEPGARFELPAVRAGTERSLYIHRGAGVEVASTAVPGKHRVEVDGAGALVVVAGPEDTEILLLQARPIGEPVAKRGPFVMNTQDEIRQAYADYQSTQFGGWPWKANDPVHEREKGRFARHIDGRFEEPPA